MQPYFRGERTIDGVLVTVDDEVLSTYSDIAQYSASTFEWGYEGDEPLQLAFAILFKTTSDKNLSKDMAENFMRNIVANFANEWELSITHIEDFLQTAKT